MNHNGSNHPVSWLKDLNWLPSSNERCRLLPEEPKIVVIGGGSGASVALQGLKQYTSRLTAIVTMFDSGGSSGLLRQELGYPPFGDLRQCLLALSRETEHAEALRSLMGFRFPKDCSLHGHSLGNLLLAGLTSLYDVDEAIEKLSRLLRIRGQVVPVTLEQADLCAELEDGSILRGETAIDLRGSPSPGISRVFVEPGVQANPRAIWAIRQADAVVLGPGDLYTSIIPNLLVNGIPEALSRTTATIIYVCNLMTKPGETDGFKASDFVDEINRYLYRASVDWAVVNTGTIPTEIQEAYAREGARPVESDIGRLKERGTRSFGGALADSPIPLHHDPTRLAEVITSLMALRQAHEQQPAVVGSGAERHGLLMPLRHLA